VLERLERKFGVKVSTEPVKIRYRETITGSVQRHEHTHKKQSGGHGQYARVVIDVEPLERGGGFEFVDKIVGGAIGKGYIPAVQRGIEEAMAAGGPAGFPVVDVKVTLVDGKEHSVDSNEMAFRQAGRVAFQEAVQAAGPVVLEPISQLDVTVPSDVLGDVMGDLNARRGRVLGTAQAPNGDQVIAALVPQSALARYATELRSITGGRGTFTTQHDHYDVLPSGVTPD
jgi:elongation factor G